MNSKVNVKNITLYGMLAALAYVFVLVGRVPTGFFILKYEPKDIVLIITGFIAGPLAGFAVAALVCLVEMLTISDTWLIGFAMNLLSSAVFVCTSAFIYKKKRNVSGAVIGLVTGCILTTGVMLLWNYLLVPIYTPYISREVVKGMLVPTFLPFNLIKGFINLSAVMLVYKPVIGTLRRAGLVVASNAGKGKKDNTAVVVVVFSYILITCVLVVLIKSGLL